MVKYYIAVTCREQRAPWLLSHGALSCVSIRGKQEVKIKKNLEREMAPGLVRLRKQKEKSGIESREAEDENKKEPGARNGSGPCPVAPPVGIEPTTNP